ncbi:MAG: hypothetical protein ACPHK8_06965, partial [Thermoplasmatota archaeon]
GVDDGQEIEEGTVATDPFSNKTNLEFTSGNGGGNGGAGMQSGGVNWQLYVVIAGIVVLLGSAAAWWYFREGAE